MKTYHADAVYLNLLEHIMHDGVTKTDRTGTGTRAVFGTQMRFDLKSGFPLLTSKKLPFRIIVEELLWFLHGDTQLKSLLDVNVHIWDEWPYKGYLEKTGQHIPHSSTDEWKSGLAEFILRIQNDVEFAAIYGDLGPIYGYQWRTWPDYNGGHIDQIADIIQQRSEEHTSELQSL